MAVPLTPSRPAPRRPESWAWAARFWVWSSKGVGRFVAVCLVAIIGFVLLAATARNVVATPASMTAWAYGLALYLAALVVFMCGVTVRLAGGRLADLLVGADNKVSTSKFQYLLWTVGIAFALTFIAFRTFVDSRGSFVCPTVGEGRNCVPDDETWQQYLILMGAPAAAAVIAKASTTQKVASGEVQSGDPSTGPGPGDLATNALGRVDIVDVQYLVFNVVAFAYFAATFVSRGTFVTVPTLLLGLTSVSAATYTLNKSLSSNKPVVKSVSPSTISPGSSLTVTGSNFFAAGADVGSVRVKVSGVEARVLNLGGSVPTSQSLVVRAPDVLTATDASVVVVVADGTESESYPVVVVQSGIVGWSGAAPAPGGEGILRVVGRPVTTARDEVLVDGVVLPATYDDANRCVRFTVPATLTPGARVTVAHLADGRAVSSAEVVLAGAGPG